MLMPYKRQSSLHVGTTWQRVHLKLSQFNRKWNLRLQTNQLSKQYYQACHQIWKLHSLSITWMIRRSYSPMIASKSLNYPLASVVRGQLLWKKLTPQELDQPTLKIIQVQTLEVMLQTVKFTLTQSVWMVNASIWRYMLQTWSPKTTGTVIIRELTEFSATDMDPPYGTNSQMLTALHNTQFNYIQIILNRQPSEKTTNKTKSLLDPSGI